MHWYRAVDDLSYFRRQFKSYFPRQVKVTVGNSNLNKEDEGPVASQSVTQHVQVLAIAIATVTVLQCRGWR
jgi:hypothetical protein